MRFKAFLISLAFSVLLVCLLFAGVYIGLPRIAENQIKKRIPGLDLPFQVDFHISRIQPTCTTLTDIKINDAPLIQYAKIYYRIESFKKISFQKVTLSGVNPDIRINGKNRISINKFVLPADSDEKNEKQMDMKWLAYLPDRIHIKNSRIHLTALGKEFFLPFNALGLVRKQAYEAAVKTVFYPFGDRIDSQIKLDFKKGVKGVWVSASDFDFGHLNSFLPESAGRFSLKGAGNFNIKSFAPFSEWTVDLSSLQTRDPFVNSVKNIGIKVTRNGKKLHLAGGAMLFLANQIQLPVNFSGAFNPELTIPYRMSFSTKKIKKVFFKNKTFSGQIDRPQINFKAIADLQKAMGSFSFKSGEGEGRFSGDLKSSFSKIVLNSGFSVNLQKKHFSIRVKPQASISDFVCTQPQGNARFPEFKFNGISTWSQKDGPTVSLIAEASRGSARLPSKKITLADIDFQIPFSYPASSENNSGKYRILTIHYDDQYTLSLKGTTQQDRHSNMIFSGTLGLDQLKGFSPRFNAQVNLNNPSEMSADFNFDPFIVTDKEIKQLYKGKTLKAEIQMTLSGKGRLALNKSKITSSMELKVKDGRVYMPDLKLTAQGINSKIAFADLMIPETIPGQFLTVEKVDVDKVKINDVKMRFSIEDAQYFLLENLWFKWCHGIVSTEAVRFPHPENDYALILYCDRLQLAELLKQMGVFHAEGDGALSGRLPIRYQNGDISFDNGFLFSTPGSGGKVKIADTDKLTAGIPMDSPQFAQLDVAREALKDFDYTWAKLLLNTFEDNLTVKMQLDGRPSKVMPFEYKRDLGRFARVSASSPGSHFQGIKLDVNLNLPFNRVMKFGNKLKSIFNQ